MNRFPIFSILLFSFIFIIFSCQEEGVEQPQKEEKIDSPVLNQNALFEFITPDKSGISFTNNIKETHGVNIITNSYMYNGGGVGILDVNNDGLQDIYFTSAQESNKLYLNKGNFQFEDITDAYGVQGLGGFTTGVTIVDINADGWQDIYVCRSGIDISPNGLATRKNLLFINNKGKSFTESADKYGVGDNSASQPREFSSIMILDGDLDLYIMNHPIDFAYVNQINVKQNQDGTFYRLTQPKDEFESDKLFRNNGNGSFTDVSVQSGIQNRAYGLSCTVSDFNDDGYPDIFVGNDYVEPDLLYINNKNGDFHR